MAREGWLRGGRGAYGGHRAQCGPAGEHAVVHGGGEVAHTGQGGMAGGHRGDGPQAVEQSPAGGRGAPRPVPARGAGQVVGAVAAGPPDQCVAAQQPAGARVGEAAVGQAGHVGAGRRAPLGAVGVLGPPQQRFGRRGDAPAGGEADAQAGRLRQGAAQAGLLEVDEADPLGGVEVVAGAGAAVEQGVPGCPAEPVQQVREFTGRTVGDGCGDGECPGRPEEGGGVGRLRARPARQRTGVLGAGGGVQACERGGVADDPVGGPVRGGPGAPSPGPVARGRWPGARAPPGAGSGRRCAARPSHGRRRRRRRDRRRSA